jgi:hypothetical protein
MNVSLLLILGRPAKGTEAGRGACGHRLVLIRDRPDARCNEASTRGGEVRVLL